MGRGGFRPGAGRKKGKKDSAPREKVTKFPQPSAKDIEKYENFDKPMYLKISKYLKKDQRALYKNLLVKYESPLKALKSLRDDMAVRYKEARIAEISVGKGKLSRAVTELGAELRSLNELIDRIESGRQDLRINILNLLTSTNKEDVSKLKKLRDKVFTMPAEESATEEAEIIEEEQEKTEENNGQIHTDLEK